MKIENQFIQVSIQLLGEPRLNHFQKNLVSYVLSFQNNNLKCFVGNSSLEKTFGVTKNQLNVAITQLNKLPFFQSKRVPHGNNFGKEMSVDMVLLEKWLSEPETQVINNTSTITGSTEITPEVTTSPIIEEKTLQESIPQKKGKVIESSEMTFDELFNSRLDLLGKEMNPAIRNSYNNLKRNQVFLNSNLKYQIQKIDSVITTYTTNYN